MVQYGGADGLQSDTTYYWIVRWWDFDGSQSPDSAVAFFHVALTNQSDWGAAAW